MTTIATLLVHGQCGRGNLVETARGPVCTVCGTDDVPTVGSLLGMLASDEFLSIVGGAYVLVSA